MWGFDLVGNLRVPSALRPAGTRWASLWASRFPIGFQLSTGGDDTGRIDYGILDLLIPWSTECLSQRQAYTKQLGDCCNLVANECVTKTPPASAGKVDWEGLGSVLLKAAYPECGAPPSLGTTQRVPHSGGNLKGLL